MGAATAVSVTIAPLWQSLCVGGTFATAGTSSTIALTRQEDNRTWTLPSLSGEGSGQARAEKGMILIGLNFNHEFN